MAVAIHTVRRGLAPAAGAWSGSIRWRVALPILSMSLLLGGLGGAAVTRGAELEQSVVASRQAIEGAGAWLSTAAAQTLTFECTHARSR